MKRVGERIRLRRELLNIPLNDLAKKVGVSSSAISQIEKAKAFPSILTLKLIADNLHTTVGELIGENESLSNNPVVTADEMKFVEVSTTGTLLYLLSHHDVKKQMDTYLLRFNKQSDLSGLFPNYHGQVFCHILLGQVAFNLEQKEYLLKKGDSIYFNSKNPYMVKNIDESISEILWVMSPPGL